MQTSSVVGGSLLSLSPSFTAYSSSDRLAQIAARVVSEFRQELDDGGLEENDDVYGNCGQFSPPRLEQEAQTRQDVKDEEENDDDEEEFEFAFVCTEGAAPTSPIAAEEVFYNGQIRPMYPVFDQTLLLRKDDDVMSSAVNKDSDMSAAVTNKPRRMPLGMLMNEEEQRETAAASCSSSEADELENLPPGTYCVWAPPPSSKASSGKGGGNNGDKSGSTGSSKRWKFRDLLSRSSSDGSTKDTFVFFPATTKTADKEGSNVVVTRKVRSSTKVVADGEIVDKRRSYLPYRQDLVGVFSNVNGLSRNLHPF